MRIPQKSIERNSERAMNRCLFMWTKMINYWDNPMSEWKFSKNCMRKRHNGQGTETFLCGQNDKLWVSPKVYWAKLTTGYEQRTFIMKNFKLLRLTKGVPETSQNCTFIFLSFSSCFIHEVKIYRLLSERHKGQGT